MKTSRRPWLIPGLVAVILFVGGVASNLVANDLERMIGPYGRWAVWIVFGIALVVTVVTAIGSGIVQAPVANSVSAEKASMINASGERSLAGNRIQGRTIVTGDKNVVGTKFGGDSVAGNKTIYMNQSASSTVSALHQLRAPVGDFVGRKQEMEILLDALRRGNHAGISGMGGTGKTELALSAAERISGDYPDAQFFINLQGTDANPRSPDEALALCLRAFLGSDATLPEDRDELLQRYRNELNSKRVLLLLDNAVDSDQVQPLLPPLGSTVLVTSRQAVILPGMTRLKLNPLSNKEARELLLKIAPHAKAAPEQICELCGYLPLAIRAAGSLLAVTDDLDPVAYATQLKDERSRLERIGKEGVEIDVAASFNLSYERLSPEVARVFRFLAVFPGTFDAVAEEAICDDSSHTHLSDLVRRSLVLYDPSTKRYRLHDLARLFADSKLRDEERALGHQRHAMHYKEVLAASNKQYLEGGVALARGLDLFDLEWSNIESGHNWVAAQIVKADEAMVQLGMTYPDAGLYILNLRLHAREWIRWLDVALASARQLNHRQGESVMLGNLGIAYKNLGEMQQAIEVFEQALLIDREIGDRRGEGADLGNLGVVYSELGETLKAIEFYEQQLLIARELSDRRSEGNALCNLGNAHTTLGETERSIQFHEQYLAITREIGDRRGEGMALGNLGTTYEKMGETQKAFQFFEQNLSIARQIGDRRGEATALFNMSLALATLGEPAQVFKYAEQSLTIFEQIENPNAAKVRAQLAAWRKETNTD